jgi:signal transduction histidine kinase
MTPPSEKIEKAEFVVDTQLFRELGELLVGTDATALLELVKNSYDADATIVTVHGQHLGSGKNGLILVLDDGNGMTLRQFRQGFLRLAGRTKTSGERRSSRFGRRYTGEKGVGRLATHKLAQLIEVESVPFSANGRKRGVRADIDWRAVERFSSMDQAGQAISLESFTPPRGRSHGTQIRLSRLRHAWDPADLEEFVASAEAFSPPPELIASARLRRHLGGRRLLFDRARVQDQKGDAADPGFRIQLTGDFAVRGAHWDELIDTVEWVLEIDARRSGVKFSVAPTDRERAYSDDHAERQDFEVSHPEPKAGPFFQARIFVRARLGGDLFRAWSRDVAGVRVYSEGFRVLPYGSPENDWLEINRDYVSRSRAIQVIAENQQMVDEVDLDEDQDSGLTLLPSDTYLGAIFLTKERSGELEALVNREGFVPNRAFANLKDLTRLGIGLLIRARAAGRLEKREAAKAARTRANPKSESQPEEPSPATWRKEVDERLTRAQADTRKLRIAAAGSGLTKQFEHELARLEDELDHLASAVNALVAEQRLTPILASVGIQMGEFVHELNGLLAMAATTDTLLGRLRSEPTNFASSQSRRAMAEAHQSVRDLRGRLERQAAYLIDLTSPTAVRRRSRQRIAERLDRAGELVKPVLERRGISFVNKVPTELRTPPMFPAEITAVLLNLLTNAIKAAGDGGRILAVTRGSGSRLILENTGTAVDLDEAERWFRPFETTTTDIDPLLGQGMGFGLPITRGILDEYGARIHFVKPRKGYATAVEVEFQE